MVVLLQYNPYQNLHNYPIYNEKYNRIVRFF